MEITAKTIGKYRLQRVKVTTVEHDDIRKMLQESHDGIKVWLDGNNFSKFYGYELIDAPDVTAFETEQDVEKALAKLIGHTDAFRRFLFMAFSPVVYVFRGYDPDEKILPERQ